MNSHPRLVVFAILIVALSALSFQGALDSVAKERVKDTTIETIGIYAVARAINAGVSVLQSVDIGPVVASVNPGEILDPLNDAVERLSGMAVWAIGSLFLQQIVLEVAASSAFKWLFGAIGLLTLCALLPMGSVRVNEQTCRISGMSEEVLGRTCNGVIRVFVVAVALRFIVPVFIACGFLVSEMLFQSPLEQGKEELTVLRDEISTRQDTPPIDSATLIRQKTDKTNELAALQKTKADYQKQLDEVKAEIDALRKGILSWPPEWLGGSESDPETDALKMEQEDLERKLDNLEQQVDTVNNDLECIDRKMDGKSCDSMLERLSAMLEKVNPKETIDRLADLANDYMVSIAKMLIVLLIKNILFPLLFLYIAMKCGISIIRRATPLVRSGLDTKRELQEAEKKILGTS